MRGASQISPPASDSISHHHGTAGVNRPPDYPVADVFLRQLAEWQLHEHRATARSALNELADVLDQHERGDINDQTAILAAWLSTGSWSREFLRLAAAR